MNKIYYIIIGLVLGVLFFCVCENMKPSNSFVTDCWIRKQPNWLVHNKVYFIGLLLIYCELKMVKIPIVLLIGSTWIGLHFAQDMAERYHMYKKKNKTLDTDINL